MATFLQLTLASRTMRARFTWLLLLVLALGCNAFDPSVSVEENVNASITMRSSVLSSANGHIPSRLFEHFDFDNDGKLSEKEVAALLKQLTRKKKEDGTRQSTLTGSSAEKPAASKHDITIDGETLQMGEGEFDLLFKQLSNLKHTKDPSKDPRMALQEDIIFVKDLVLVFAAATMGGIIAIQFRQPPLIGFLIGGMVIGPGGLGVVTELVEIETLASLGIAFLLFSLGIEFSVSELHGVRKVVVAGGLSSMLGIVLLTGVLSFVLNLVKSIPEAVALGLAVSLSSTAVVLQCLPSPAQSSQTSMAGAANGGRGHRRNTPVGTPTGQTPSVPPSSSPTNSNDELASADGGIVTELKLGSSTFDSPRSRKVMLGLLVFQDVMIGLILALLPTLQGSLTSFFEEFMSAMLRLGCFITLSLIVAEFVLPSMTERLDTSKSNEVFTVACVVFCLGMSYMSERMGLAIELGAFAAGIMLSESRLKHRVEESISSVRVVFSAIFFISVGMMIHWRYFYQNFLKMAILLVVVLTVKSIVMGAVVLALGGLPLRTALACGASIAQAGEFTFVIASKGQSLQLFSASEARMINGATALSMLVTPYIIRSCRRWTSARPERSVSDAVADV